MDKVQHFELPAQDMARAKKFYSSVFGWKTQDVPGMEYAMASTVEVDEKTRMPKEPGAINGGIVKKGMGMDTPSITITVADIDKAVQKATKAGGKLAKEKQPVMDMGFVAYIQDTEGNLVGLWQSARKQ